MAMFKSKKTTLQIPKYGCVVFPSDTLHAGASNPTGSYLFRGFCVLRRSGEAGEFKKPDTIFIIEDMSLKETMEGF